MLINNISILLFNSILILLQKNILCVHIISFLVDSQQYSFRHVFLSLNLRYQREIYRRKYGISFPLAILSFDVFSGNSLFSLKLVKYFVRVSFHSPREILAPVATSYSIQFGSNRLDSKGSLIKFLSE